MFEGPDHRDRVLGHTDRLGDKVLVAFELGFSSLSRRFEPLEKEFLALLQIGHDE